MKLLFALFALFSMAELNAQPTKWDTQEDKKNYYANPNNIYKTNIQKDKYRKVANVTGGITIALLLVSAYSYTKIDIEGGDSPNHKAVVSFLGSGFLSCILGGVALSYNSKSNGTEKRYLDFSKGNTTNVNENKWTINITKNGVGLICSF